jgi:hypothetical protein
MFKPGFSGFKIGYIPWNKGKKIHLKQRRNLYAI